MYLETISKVIIITVAFGLLYFIFEMQMAFEGPANIVNPKMASAMAKERHFDA